MFLNNCCRRGLKRSVLFVFVHPSQEFFGGNSSNVTSKDVPKSSGSKSINEKIGTGVEGHQTMGNGGGAKCPEAEAVAVTFNSLAKDVQGQELVNIKDKTKGMAEKKEENNDKENDSLLRFVGLFLLVGRRLKLRPIHQLTTPLHNPIDAVIEKAQTNEWYDALNEESSDVDVDDDVSIIQSKLRGGCPAAVDLNRYIGL